MIESWCVDCRQNKRELKIMKMLTPRTQKQKASRKIDGTFNFDLKHRIQNVLFILLGASLVTYSGFHLVFPIQSTVVEFKSPLGAVQAIMSSPTPTLTPTPTLIPEQLMIEQEIQEVFGEYSDKAMLLLQGNGPGTCAENRTLDPKAVNRNWSDVEGVYSSSDFGVFQINDKWQKVYNEKFLFDPVINIRIAWRIFENNEYSFKMWTCGKVYGI